MNLFRYRKKSTTKCREIHFIKAETGQQSPRQRPDGDRRSDDGKPRDSVSDTVGNIRWHHHIVMDGALDMETVESCWKQSSRNEVRRLQTDENGLSGMANYIVEEKNRVPSEKRWNSSQGLRDPRIKVVHSKRPAAGGSYKKIGSFVDGMVKDRDSIPEILKKWYPDMDFTNANVYYNDFNCMFYIHARMRKRRLQSEKTEKTSKTCRTT